MNTGKLVATTIAIAALGTIPAVTGCNGLSGADGLVVGKDREASSQDSTRATRGSGKVDSAPARTADTTPPADLPALPGPLSDPNRQLACGSSFCSGATPNCCQNGDGTARCAGMTDVCGGALIACGGTADCGTGEVCCAFSDDFAQCVPGLTCRGIGTHVLCKDDRDCDPFDSCTDHLRAFDRFACE